MIILVEYLIIHITVRENKIRCYKSMKFIYSTSPNNACLLCARKQAECWSKYGDLLWIKPSGGVQVNVGAAI